MELKEINYEEELEKVKKKRKSIPISVLGEKLGIVNPLCLEILISIWEYEKKIKIKDSQVVLRCGGEKEYGQT